MRVKHSTQVVREVLQKFKKQLNHQILTLQKCEFIGSKLGFNLPSSMKAFFNYFLELHITLYDDDSGQNHSVCHLQPRKGDDLLVA